MKLFEKVRLLLQVLVLLVLVLPLAPSMADTASVFALTDNRFTALGPVMPAPEGKFIGVAKSSVFESGGSGWTVVIIDGDGRIEPAARLPLEPGVVAGSLAVTRAAALHDGGMLVVGSAALDKYAQPTRVGWAARIDDRGALVWSRIYDPDNTTEGTAEQFNFAVIDGARSTVLGGTRASGETCAGESSAFIRVVDLETGMSPAGIVRLPGKGRRGLVDGILIAPNRLFLAGWQAEQRDDLKGCRQSTWLVATNANGADASDLHWPGAEWMMPVSVAADEGTGMTMYLRPSSVAPQHSTRVPMRISADIVGSSLRIRDLDVSATRQGSVSPFGMTGLALFQRSEERAARIGLRFEDPVGRCLGDIEIEAGNREQLSLSGSTGFGTGAGLIYGTATSEARRGVWVASLSAPARPPTTIAIGPDAKGTTWLQRVDVGRAVIKIEVAAKGEVVMSARQFAGDVDLYLTAENGQLIAISDNIADAAEHLALDLKPGTYTLAIVTNSPRALAQVSVSGRHSLPRPPGAASTRSLRDANAVAAALKRLGYANAGPSQVETSYSEALAAFAVSQCLSDPQESEQRLMIAAARAQTHEVRRFEAAARRLTQQAGRLTISVRKDDEDEQLGYARRLRGEGSAGPASAVQVMFNAGEAILSGTNAPRPARLAPSSSGASYDRFELTDLTGPMVWTNAAEQRLLTVRSQSPIVFGSIEQPDGSIFQGLLGTMTFAKSAAQNQIRISPEIGRVLHQTGQVALAHPNVVIQHRSDIAWSSAVWSEQSVSAPGLELAWPVAGVREVSRGFGQGEGELANGSLFAVSPGKRIMAAHDGVVLYAGDDFRKFKSSIVIEGENRVVSVYGFSGRSTVATGSKVRKGEQVARIEADATGAGAAKLYFEVRRGPTAVNPAALFTDKPPAAVDDRESAPPKTGTIPKNLPSVVYFSTDDATLTPETQQSLRAQAAWLKVASEYELRLEGHDDERSSRKNAIKLGEERANAVRDYLITLGVDSARLRTISYGKERPVATCSDISCFSQNRRVETVLMSKRERAALPKIMNDPAKEPRVAMRARSAPALPLPGPAAPRAAPEHAAPGAADAVKLGWPAKGRIIMNFGLRADNTHSDGINIAVPMGTPVLAAESGVVAYAGSELQGYGNLILLRHDNGWVTVYAHNEEILVKSGDKVRRGQGIAKAGKTGAVDQPQLHFEVRHGAKPVDPLLHMEKM